MARVYDIISRLENGNQKPVVKIDEAHEYKINTSKAAAFKIMAIAEDESIKEDKRVEDIVKVALGGEAFNYIESKELSITSYNTVINVIMAAISDVDLEEVENEAKKVKKSPRK
ncbi:hypothetical protein [Clostridium sp.]|uniref:hypothetical protein n=1 Tax=Clostridium sp. TaxID=1506 RepID=UPI002633D8C4|nr:hypothetical protein [Clostridium sp.]